MPSWRWIGRLLWSAAGSAWTVVCWARVRRRTGARSATAVLLPAGAGAFSGT
ncbi:hypothetical protein [Streptomyces longwoodensis]|uniref:hypothetical protein n=1 Tax=Streptomyces longwoodensis TaxID=68231 RepID=UPI00384D8F6F